MIAASFLQILLAVTVLVLFLGTAVMGFVGILVAISERPPLWGLMIFGCVIGEIWLIATFAWLGAGPMNG